MEMASENQMYTVSKFETFVNLIIAEMQHVPLRPSKNMLISRNCFLVSKHFLSNLLTYFFLPEENGFVLP